MEEPIEESYFNWLCAKVRNNPIPVYLDLFRLLHKVEFIWTVQGDKNRAADGKELREYFCSNGFIEPDLNWLQEPCSIFEMLIALSDRANFQTDIPIKDWFWRFISNLKLEDFRRVSRSDEAKIHDILYTLVWRLYDDHGNGGLFPLRNPKQDQRKIEIWYQMFEYIDDQGLV